MNSIWKLQDNPYGGDVANSYNDGPPSPGRQAARPVLRARVLLAGRRAGAGRVARARPSHHPPERPEGRARRDRPRHAGREPGRDRKRAAQVEVARVFQDSRRARRSKRAGCRAGHGRPSSPGSDPLRQRRTAPRGRTSPTRVGRCPCDARRRAPPGLPRSAAMQPRPTAERACCARGAPAPAPQAQTCPEAADPCRLAHANSAGRADWFGTVERERAWAPTMTRDGSHRRLGGAQTRQNSKLELLDTTCAPSRHCRHSEPDPARPGSRNRKPFAEEAMFKQAASDRRRRGPDCRRGAGLRGGRAGAAGRRPEDRSRRPGRAGDGPGVHQAHPGRDARQAHPDRAGRSHAGVRDGAVPAEVLRLRAGRGQQGHLPQGHRRATTRRSTRRRRASRCGRSARPRKGGPMVALAVADEATIASLDQIQADHARSSPTRAR